MKIDKLAQTQPELYVLIGLPASGKSTWVANKTKSSGKSFTVISSDDIIQQRAEELGKTYDEVFQDNVAHAISQLRVNAERAFKNGDNIIWDQTNLSPKKRKGILHNVPKNYKKIAVVFEVDDTELTRRLTARAKDSGKSIPPHIITSMRTSFTAPSKSEGFDEIINV